MLRVQKCRKRPDSSKLVSNSAIDTRTSDKRKESIKSGTLSNANLKTSPSKTGSAIVASAGVTDGEKRDCFIVTDRARGNRGLPLLTVQDLAEVVMLRPLQMPTFVPRALPESKKGSTSMSLEVQMALKKKAKQEAAEMRKKHEEDETFKYALSKEQLEELHETFKLYDRDMDGYITGKEMCEVIVGLARMPPKDMNPSCKIGFEEFAYRFADLLKEVNPEEEVRKALQIFDKKDTKLLSMDELRHALTHKGERLTDHEVDLLFENIYSDKNNMVLLENVVNEIAPEIIDAEEELEYQNETKESKNKEKSGNMKKTEQHEDKLVPNADNAKPELKELNYESTKAPTRVSKGV